MNEEMRDPTGGSAIADRPQNSQISSHNTSLRRLIIGEGSGFAQWGVNRILHGDSTPGLNGYYVQYVGRHAGAMSQPSMRENPHAKVAKAAKQKTGRAIQPPQSGKAATVSDRGRRARSAFDAEAGLR